MAKRGKVDQIAINKYPSVHWEKFFASFDALDTTPLDDWQSNHLIAYFCRKYKNYYKIDYTFKFNSSAPSKSYEVFQIRKLSNMLSSSPNIIKDYIDWFFEQKIIARKRRITSMAFMTDAITVNEYKFKKLLISQNSSIDRNTIIPPNYMKVISEFVQNISTYGDLAFIKRCMDSGNASDPKYSDMMTALKKAGMDILSLDKVK